MRRHEEGERLLIREADCWDGGDGGSVVGNGCRRVVICDSDGLQKREIGEAGLSA
jgi:hypothetical protein